MAEWRRTRNVSVRYKLCVCGSNDFVSSIDPNDRSCHPPGLVELVSGWDNPDA